MNSSPVPVKPSLQDLVTEFVGLLDKKEESGLGYEFHPNQISSCRVLDCDRLEELLNQMREAIKEPPYDIGGFIEEPNPFT